MTTLDYHPEAIRIWGPPLDSKPVKGGVAYYAKGHGMIATARECENGSWRILRRGLHGRGGTARIEFATRKRCLEALDALTA